MSVGNRIFLKRALPPKEVVEAFRTIPAADIGDAINRSCAMHPRIRLMSKPDTPIMAGVALTVKTRAGDNLFIHKALDMASESDIIVVSNEGDDSRALIGANMAYYAERGRKISGLIFDGPIRDIDEIRTMRLPIYAVGTTPGGPYKEGPGEINVPISCGEAAVCPGDIIVADHDGIVVIPCVDAKTVLHSALKQRDLNAQKCANAKLGRSNRIWVDETLRTNQVEVIDGLYGRSLPST